jgi:large subunit ribosomal protein L5e
MGFVKIVKNKAYYKRYQVKYRRRRECKTDYYARKRLIIQDKNKYKTPKYRFVVRITNKDVVCQIFSSDLDHDVCLASAYSHELGRYGVKTGLTNYAACYCTGLLLARRVNDLYKLPYEGTEEVTGEEYHVEQDEEDRAPFRALLDVGLAPTTTGARIWGALKGACDGGLDVPHTSRRFPGSSLDGNGGYSEDAEKHREYIFGGHVSAYMESLQESDKDAFEKQFGAYIKAGVSAGDLEDMYTNAHAAIRAEPFKARDALEKGRFGVRTAAKDADATYPKKVWQRIKMSKQQRKDRIRQKLTAKGIKSQAGNLLAPIFKASVKGGLRGL